MERLLFESLHVVFTVGSKFMHCPSFIQIRVVLRVFILGFLPGALHNHKAYPEVNVNFFLCKIIDNILKNVNIFEL